MRPTLILGYVVGVVALVVGILLLVGYLVPRGMEGSNGVMFRTIAGIVALLYGLYRLVVTESQRKREARVR